MRYYSNLPESLMRDATMAAIKNGWYPSVPLWTQGTPAYNPGPMPLGEAPMYLNSAPVYLNGDSSDDGAEELAKNAKMKMALVAGVAVLAAYAGYKYYKDRRPAYLDIYA